MATHPQLESPLLRLPQEILDRIYGCYLAVDQSDFVNTLRPLHDFIEKDGHSGPLPALMLTCKRVYYDLHEQIHHEAALKVYTTELGVRIGLVIRGVLRYEHLHKLYFIIAMEHPHWNRWLPFLEEVAKRATELRELIVDWQPRQQILTSRWDITLQAKKEQLFFRILGGLRNLKTIRVYGDIPAQWRQSLGEATTARVIQYKHRWWRDPGGDW